jgi:hypothetical protein
MTGLSASMLLALPHVLCFETGFGPVLEAIALRRSGLVVRRTRFSEMVVDERVLWRAFPLAPRVVRPICYLVFGGRGYLDDGGETLDVEPGDVIAFRAQGSVMPRWHDVRMIEIAWTEEVPSPVTDPAVARDLFLRAKAGPDEIASLVAGFDDVWSLDRRGAPLERRRGRRPDRQSRRLSIAQRVGACICGRRLSGAARASPTVRRRWRDVRSIFDRVTATFVATSAVHGWSRCAASRLWVCFPCLIAAKPPTRKIAGTTAKRFAPMRTQKMTPSTPTAIDA